ncbi:unnamed protein product [Moneuplotes crassus]|uniref:Uncharacterized protein n=1 Tax=Euplotes crassus TaxID=5936 RepID=A0AAD2DAR4_EUPCR|nr:unnamed protein product [Moneuplotes crassus]
MISYFETEEAFSLLPFILIKIFGEDTIWFSLHLSFHFFTCGSEFFFNKFEDVQKVDFLYLIASQKL